MASSVFSAPNSFGWKRFAQLEVHGLQLVFRLRHPKSYAVNNA